MKKLIFLFGISLMALNSTAQRGKDEAKLGFNAGAELGLATGGLNSIYSLGIGATANLEYKIDDKLKALVNSGLIQYIGKKISGTQTKIRNSAAIPILGGVKYYVANNFYGQAALGLTIFSGAGGSTKFTYSPGIGFKANEKIDILFK